MARVCDIIEKESARLEDEDEDGIGPKRRKRIKEAQYEQIVIRKKSCQAAFGGGEDHFPGSGTNFG